MATVNEILKASGFTEEQIAALDAKALTAFASVLTTAEQQETTGKAAQQEAERIAAVAVETKKQAEIAAQQAVAAREAAELAQRSNVEFYETQIVPGLTGWEAEQKKLQMEKANAEALAAFYKTQNDGAKVAGFLPTDAPSYVPPVENNDNRDGKGRYVAGKDGSPTFTMDDIDQRLGNGISNVGWAMQEYQRLTGQFLPDSFDNLSKEATAQKLPFRDYVARKYDFAGKQQAIQQRMAQEHDDKVRAEATAAKEAEWKAKMDAREAEIAAEKKRMAESVGNNPDVRQPAGASKIAEVARAVKAGEFKDPTKMTDAERRSQTRNMIHKEIAEREPVNA